MSIKQMLFQRIEQALKANNMEELAVILSEQRSSDIAEIVELLDEQGQLAVFEVLNNEVGADVLIRVDEATRSELFELFHEEQLVGLVTELDPDDAADVLAEMDTQEVQGMLKSLDIQEAEQIKELMDYSEDSAGGIMDPVVLSVTDDATVNEAIKKIREFEVEEDFFSLFVVDKTGRFMGDVRLRLLITCKAETKIHDLIDTGTIYVSVDTDQEDVRNIFKKNDLIVVPVLDQKHRLVGRITADRVIEVAEEEAAEDVLTMAGTGSAELETFSIFHAARVRLTWLLPCLAGTAVTAVVGFLFRHLFI